MLAQRFLAAAASMLLASTAASATAWAQSTTPPPDSPNLDLMLFEPALGTHSFLTVEGADTMSKGQLQLQVGVNYMTHPFSVYVVDKSKATLEATRADVVDSIFLGFVSMAYGITRNIQIGVLVPTIFSEHGAGLDPSTGMPQPGGLSVSGLGDARLEAIWRVYEKNRMTLAVVPALTVPTSVKLGSDESMFLGDDLPTFRPRVAWEWVSSDAKWNGGANLGLILRKPHTVYSSDVGQQLSYGVAAAYHVTRRFDVIAEMFGRKGFSLDTDESPLEIDGALRLGLAGGLAIQAGGGGGIIKGVGAPAARLFASVSWAPDYGDDDGDGIPNEYDKCPNEPEDKDGFQDADGCPDPDNDGDGIPDALDKCPNEAEDFDGFQDEDGCPDLDNDGDGIPDDKDACPNDKEDHLPPFPDDGCPKGMGPGDEPNAAAPAAAPVVAGGLEPDRDHDGIPDKDDKCPDDPETVNGVKDDDGCPDTGGKVLARLQGTEVVLTQPVELEGTRIKTATKAMLDQAALYMRGQAYLIGRWRVTVVPDKRQKLTAAAEGEVLKAYLVSHGVPAAAIEVKAADGKRAQVRIVGVAKPDGTPLDEEPAVEIVPN